MGLQLRGERVAYSLIPCFILATLITVMRLGLRLKRQKTLDASDYMITLAWCFFVAYTGIVLKMTYNPSGSVHIGDMNFLEIKEFLPLSFASQICAAFIATTSKLSLLLFWHSIFLSRSFRIWNYIVMGTVVAWLIAIVLVASFRCDPIRGVWDIWAVLLGAKCIDTGIIISAYEAGNIFTDLLIVFLPLNQLRKLQMRKTKKVGVSFLFALGGLVIVTSAVRLWYSNDQKLPYFNIGTIVDASKIYLWSNIQNSASIICACLPMMLPLLRPLDKYVKSLSSSSKSLIQRIKGSFGARLSSSDKRRSPLLGRSPQVGKSQSSSDLEKGGFSGGQSFSDGTPPLGGASHATEPGNRASMLFKEWSSFLRGWDKELPDPMASSSSQMMKSQTSMK